MVCAKDVKNMLQAMIFDIDRTLLDSNDFHAHAWSRAFAAYKKSISVKELQPHMEKGSDKLLPEFLNPQEVEGIGKLISKKHSELFKKIKDANVKIALASSADAKDVEHAKIIAQIYKAERGGNQL